MYTAGHQLALEAGLPAMAVKQLGVAELINFNGFVAVVFTRPRPDGHAEKAVMLEGVLSPFFVNEQLFRGWVAKWVAKVRATL